MHQSRHMNRQNAGSSSPRHTLIGALSGVLLESCEIRRENSVVTPPRNAGEYWMRVSGVLREQHVRYFEV